MSNPMILALGLLAGAPAGTAQEPGPGIEHFAQRGALNGALLTGRREGALRVLAGGALAGSGSRSTAFLADVLEGARLDAVAVGYDDLASDMPGVRELLGSPKVPFVCANVKGAGRTHVVCRMGAVRVAFVGVTRPPSYVKVMPVKDWTIEDPATALKRLLPEISKESDVILLLAVMDRIECAALVKEVPGIHAALVPAGVVADPDPLPAGTTTLVQSPVGTTTFSRLTFKAEGGKMASVANRVETAAVSAADRERAKALFTRHKEGVDVDRLVAGVVLAPPPAAVKETGPLTALESGKTQPVVVVRSVGGVEIRIDSIRVVAELDGRAAPQRSSWLVIRSEWRNLIPPTSAGGRALDTVYSVADAANNLYVVANGRTLMRLDADLSTGPGGLLSGRSIKLDKQGSTRLGNLVFPLPPSGAETLELQFYDFRRPPAAFPLLSRPAGAKVGEEKPVVPAVKNEVLEAGVFAVRREKGNAPAGMAVAVIDLRARSLATVEVEGRRIGVAGDIDGAWKGLRLVTEGGRESEPEPGLPAAPRFLPGAMTGWEVRFLIPEKALTFDLRWSLPEIGLPDGRALKPAPLVVQLAAKGGECPSCLTVPGPNDKFCGKCGRKLGP
ncbi:MAG TPA: hypothetical protein VJB14_06335 [Planctomycetota bacterium]|nr:hypothetical protein [Planctomycetota bacterium]